MDSIFLYFYIKKFTFKNFFGLDFIYTSNKKSKTQTYLKQ